MKKPAHLLFVAVSLPFLAGCFSMVPTPLPQSPAERSDLDVRGVIVGTEDSDPIVFDDIQSVEWTDDAVSFFGDQRDDGSSELVSRSFPLSSLSGVVVRQLDAGKMSGVVGGVIVGATVVIALLVTGSFDPNEQGGA